jgi:DNA-binding MarR family transcriptional regulator
MKHYDPRTYTVGDSVGYLIRRSSVLLRQQLDAAFEGHGLTFVQWVTLMRLRDDPALTAGDICRDLNHDSGAFTRVVDHLEAHGLVRRERSDSDRRVVRLFLTTAGRHAVQGMVPLVVDQLNDALQDLTAAEVATLTKLLRRVTARLDARDAAALPDTPAVRKAPKP